METRKISIFEQKNRRESRMKKAAIILMVLAVITLVGAGSAWALPSMGSDKTQAACLSCHPAAAPKAPAPAPAPTKPAPAPKPASGKLTLKTQAVTVNGVTQTVPVGVIGDKTLVQVRAFADMLGTAIAWDNKAKVATFKAGTNVIAIHATHNKAVINGQDVAMEVRLVNGRVFAELDALTDAVKGAPAAAAKKPNYVGAEGYVGSDACATCHKGIYDKWSTSWHTKKVTYGPNSEYFQEAKSEIFPWVKEKWNELDTYMILDRKDANTNYVAIDKVKIEEVDFVVGATRKQRYMVYYDGGPRKAWLATTQDGGISWKLDKSVVVDYPGNKERAGYKLLFIEASKGGTLNANNYGEWRSWQERCIACHTTGFDYQAWDAAKAAYVKGERADLKDLFVADLRIGCEACHGQGKEHAAKPSKDNIINPAKLVSKDLNAAQMVCEQCHTRPDRSTKSSLANDLRGYRIGDKYEDFAVITRPAWGTGNRQVSIDGKGRRDHQMSMDIRISEYLRPWGVHGKMTCFTCHDSHNVGNNPQQKSTKLPPQETCNQCHGVTNGQPNMPYKWGLDGARGWGKYGFGNWGNEGGRGASKQHLFNLDAQGRVFGLTPDQYVWALKPGTSAADKKNWEAIWPWEQESFAKKGYTVKIGAEPWK